MKERTLAIIKPDVIQKNLAGQLIDHLLRQGFEVIAMKMVKLTKATAGEFYAVHKGRKSHGHGHGHGRGHSRGAGHGHDDHDDNDDNDDHDD